MIIGVVAPSMGIKDIEDLEKTRNAIKYFESLGHKVILGNIFNNIGYASSDKISRANDFMQIYKKSDIIISLAGGEMMIEILEYLDYEYLRNNKKIFMGYSDNTNLSFVLTTLYDFNPIYGLNFKAFGKKTDRVIKNFIDLLFNNKNKFIGFDKIEEIEPKNYLDSFNLTKPNKWKYTLSNKMKGVLLGGCLDCILSLIGTKFDNTVNYCKDKEIIWYFDIYGLDIFGLKRALLQLRLAGYFNTTKGIIISRFFKSQDMFNTTLEDILKEFSNEYNIPVFYDVDLGHIPPVIPFINGFNVEVSINDGIGEIIYDKGQIKALTR